MVAAAHQLINQTSGEVEYYTPVEIIEAARRVLGGVIDLDPASSAKANEIVRAMRFFTEADNSLNQVWHGRIWMNHPFHAGWNACDDACKRKTCEKRGHVYRDIPGNADWVYKIEREYRSGRMVAACCITFASTSEQWFQPLLKHPQCFLSPRTNYRLPDGSILKGVSKGSVVTYYGNDVDRFATEFQGFGQVKVAYA
ncbi:MAG TPA: hypothetical protein VFX97_17110 [Pyrinomonadaceae bacterium]|nr:hypothetical protein [Pyrinomonadaceae bacterium]